MKRVLKWTIPVDDQPHSIGGGRVIHATCQDTPEEVQVWTEESDRGVNLVQAQIFGTGQTYSDRGEAMASVAMHLGRAPLVWHVVVFPDTKRNDW